MDARAARNASGVPVAEEASDGVYRVLFEGLESALALGLPTTRDEDERNRRYAIAADGRQYLTTAPSLAQLATTATKTSAGVMGRKFREPSGIVRCPDDCAGSASSRLSKSA
jgi:hypothetical protein